MEKTDDQKPKDGKYGIHQCDDRLRLEDESESFGDFLENDTVFFIEKGEIAAFHRFQICAYLLSVYQKHITENEGDEEFCQKNSDILDILEGPLHEFLNRFRIEDTIQSLVDSEIHIHSPFQTGNSIPYLVCDDRSVMDESLSLFQQMGYKSIEE